MMFTCISFAYPYRVAFFSDANKMPMESLAKIFGPTIVGHGSSRPDPSVQWKDTEKQPKVQVASTEWYHMSPKNILELLASKIHVPEGVLVGDLGEVMKKMIERLRKMQLAPEDMASSALLPTELSTSTESSSSLELSSSTDINPTHTPSPLLQISTAEEELASLIKI